MSDIWVDPVAIQPFRAWVQKVLPTVYDDSLSYQELWGKVVYKLDEVIDELNKQGTNITVLKAEWTAYKNEVNETLAVFEARFSDENMGRLIDEKLDAMVESGAFQSIVTPIITAQIPDAVSNWLQENLTPTEPPVDDSLSISGAAADSKTVGDLIFKGRTWYDETGETPVLINEPRVFTYFKDFANVNDITEMPGDSYCYTMTDSLSGKLPGFTDTLKPNYSWKITKQASGTFTGTAARYILEAWDGPPSWIGSTRSGVVGLVWHRNEVTIDDTLSISGAAADSKTVGDKLKIINDNYSVDETINSGWANEIYANSTGNVSASNKYLHSPKNLRFNINHNNIYVRANDGYKLLIGAWNASGEWLGTYRLSSGSGIFSPTSGALGVTEFYFGAYPDNYMEVFVYRTDNANIDISEATNIIFTNNRLGPDNTLSTEYKAADAAYTGKINNAMYAYNACDLLEHKASAGSKKQNGITFMYDKLNSTTNVNGTATNLAFFNLFFSSTSLLNGVEAGKSYRINITGASTTIIRIGFLQDSSILELLEFNTSRIVNVPASTNNMYIRLQVASGSVISNENVRVEWISTKTNKELSETVDIAGYLTSTNDTTDRTSEILSILNSRGVCNLGPGSFTVKNLQMPERTTINGCGERTVLNLPTDNDALYIIKPNKFCNITNLAFSGNRASVPTSSSSIGTRCGIYWKGSYSSDTSTAQQRTIVSNCWFFLFDGAAIWCEDQGTPVSNSIKVSDAYIWNSVVGIYIKFSSEYNIFTNVSATGCTYGCINNGGNNIFTGCDFSNSRKTAFMIDDSSGNMTNNSHGSAVGCMFNHTTSNENPGIAIDINGADSGFMFVGCQIFYGSIKSLNSKGTVFSACNFGTNGAGLECTGTGNALFIGCMFQSQPTIPASSIAHFANCYLRDGSATVPPTI